VNQIMHCGVVQAGYVSASCQRC